MGGGGSFFNFFLSLVWYILLYCSRGLFLSFIMAVSFLFLFFLFIFKRAWGVLFIVSSCSSFFYLYLFFSQRYLYYSLCQIFLLPSRNLDQNCSINSTHIRSSLPWPSQIPRGRISTCALQEWRTMQEIPGAGAVKKQSVVSYRIHTAVQ